MLRPGPVAAVLVVFAVPVAHAWQVAVSGTPPAARPSSIVVDAAGDVIAAGRAIGPGTDEDAMVVKLAGGDGSELWQHRIAGAAGGSDFYRAVTVGPDRIIAVGRVLTAVGNENVPDDADALFARFSPTGTPAWEVVLDGGAEREDDAMAVALDEAGNVLVAGESTPVDGTSTHFTVWKRQVSDGAALWTTLLGGTSGTARALAVAGSDVVAAGDVGDFMVVTRISGSLGGELWRTDVAGSANANDIGNAVAFRGNRVVVAGQLVSAAGDPDFAVVSLDAATGEENWRVTIDGDATGDADDDEVLGLAIDAAGDVLAVGRLSNVDSNGRTDGDALAVKLARATGTELWRTVVKGSLENEDIFQAIALDAAGDLLVTGTIRNRGTRANFLVGKLANATGAEIWRHEIDGTEHEADTGAAVAVGPMGDLVAAGRVRNFAEDGFVVTRRVGANGGDFPCADGTLDPGESCDDGNTAAGDDCRGDCTVEVCGDGILDPQEGCDDGNAVADDCCSDVCSVQVDGTPCDDGDACTLLDSCDAGACTPAENVTCTAPSPCHLAICNPADGSCSSTPKAEGAPCNDGDACTLIDQCLAGACTGRTPIHCDDAEPCTSDGCAPQVGCSFTPLVGFESITCIFERPDIADACGAAIPRRIDRRIQVARSRIDRAALVQKAARAGRVLKGATKQLDKALRAIAAQRNRGSLDATCAGVLENELGETAARARDVRAQLATQ